MGTGRGEAAGARPHGDDRKQGRDRALIESHRADQQSGCGARSGVRRVRHVPVSPGPPAGIWRQASAKVLCNRGSGQERVPGRAIINRSHPGGTVVCSCRKTSRRRRLARFRQTAGPTAAVEAITHTLGPLAAEGSSGRRRHQRVKARHSSRRPCSRTTLISLARLRRRAGGNFMGGSRYCPPAPAGGAGRAESDDRQPLAALEAAGLDHLAAVSGGHPGAVADLAGAFLAVRAECWLHKIVKKRGSEVRHGPEGVKGCLGRRAGPAPRRSALSRRS